MDIKADIHVVIFGGYVELYLYYVYTYNETDLAIKADIMPDDREEHVSAMEPLLIGSGSRHRPELNDLVLELVQKSTAFRHSLPASMTKSLADLVRSMNCYYSNLIEGHNTHPIDIERALKNDYSRDRRKRNLQKEAKAHIEVQTWIDEGGLRDKQALQIDGIQEIHKRFCELLPEELLIVQDPINKQSVQVKPGILRDRDVQVGTHIAVSAGAVPRFLKRFGDVYAKTGKIESILSTAAAHHRMLWIHPFLDGNGRVARLMSHAVLLQALDSGAVWSVARGLARNVTSYKQLLANCDQPRRNALDGRGSLSEEALVEFTRFFLKVCIDQVEFMQSLIQPDRLRARVLLWAQEEIRLGSLPFRADSVLEAMLYRGELARGEIESIVGKGARQSRRIVASLIERGVLESDSTRAPLRLVFPATLASRWMPGLFPEHDQG